MSNTANLKPTSKGRRVQIERWPHLVFVIEHEIQNTKVDAPLSSQREWDSVRHKAELSHQQTKTIAHLETSTKERTADRRQPGNVQIQHPPIKERHHEIFLAHNAVGN